MSALLLAALGLGLRPASAFCGTYVGQAGSEIYNSVSQVAVVRQGDRTTLTLANDFEGEVTDFALVMPVPEVLTEEDVRTVDASAIQALDAYSAPRLVSYECEDFEVNYDSGADTGAAGGGTGEDADGSVVVESSFTAGEYAIVVLSASSADDLLAWLDSNGFAVEAEAESLLGEYIHDGAYFVAAKVSLEAAAEGRTYLSPLQFGYRSEVFGLPIRLGTLNSQGVQDLLVYAFTDYESGQVGISNYPQVEVEDDCMWRESAGGDFGAFYTGQLDAAFALGGGAAWTQEYAWAPSGCDPCSSEPPSDEVVQELGFTEGATEAFFTRLHLRYSPEAASSDVVFYESNLQDFDQIKFIQYLHELEDRFEVCGEGFVDDPGSCDEGPVDSGEGGGDGGDGGAGTPVPDPTGYDKADHVEEPKGCAYGCAAAGAPSPMVGLLGLGLLAARRRRAAS